MNLVREKKFVGDGGNIITRDGKKYATRKIFENPIKVFGQDKESFMICKKCSYQQDFTALDDETYQYRFAFDFEKSKCKDGQVEHEFAKPEVHVTEIDLLYEEFDNNVEKITNAILANPTKSLVLQMEELILTIKKSIQESNNEFTEVKSILDKVEQGVKDITNGKKTLEHIQSTIDAVFDLSTNVNRTLENVKTNFAFIFIIFALYVSLFGGLWIWTLYGTSFSNSITELQTELCLDHYPKNFFKVNMEPWSEDNRTAVNLEDVYIDQIFHTSREQSDNLLDFYSWNQGKKPKRLLLVAEQGEGKTTSIKATTMNWCNKIMKKEHQYNLRLKYIIESNPITKALSHPINLLMKYPLEPLPELILAFEFKDLCKHRLIADTITRLVQKPNKEKVVEILTWGIDTVLFAFDGYDENNRLYVCKNGIDGTELDSIIRREARKNFNLIVTSRPWRSADLLNVDRYGFEKVTFLNHSLDHETRNVFIRNFFSIMEDNLSDELIKALDGPQNIIPLELQNVKRMLLNICNIWKHNKEENTIPNFFNAKLFLDDLWEVMRLTFNMKYPESEMSKQDLLKMREKIGMIEEKEMSYEDINAMFGDEDSLDVFYFGVYSTAVKLVGNIGEVKEKVSYVKETPGLEFMQKEERLKDQKRTLVMKHIPWFLVFVMSPFILMFDINRKLEAFGGSSLSLVILLVSFWYHDLQPMETYELTCHIFKLWFDVYSGYYAILVTINFGCHLLVYQTGGKLDEFGKFVVLYVLIGMALFALNILYCITTVITIYPMVISFLFMFIYGFYSLKQEKPLAEIFFVLLYCHCLMCCALYILYCTLLILSNNSVEEKLILTCMIINISLLIYDSVKKEKFHDIIVPSILSMFCKSLVLYHSSLYLKALMCITSLMSFFMTFKIITEKDEKWNQYALKICAFEAVILISLPRSLSTLATCCHDL